LDTLELTPTRDQIRFALAYFENGGNATQAAVDTWPRVKSRAYAGVKGSSALKKPAVRKLLESFRERTAPEIRGMFERYGAGLDRRVEVTATMVNRGMEEPHAALRAVEIANKMEDRNRPEQSSGTVNFLTAVVLGTGGSQTDNRDTGQATVYREVSVGPDEISRTPTVHTLADADRSVGEPVLVEGHGVEVPAGRVLRDTSGAGLPARDMEPVP